MARIAAYYQEDFHYPPPRNHKKRKETYIFYDEPKHELITDQFHGGKIRNLALSDPMLHPLVPSNLDIALEQRAMMGGNYFSPPLQPQEYENFYIYNRQFGKYPNGYDNESLCSFNLRPAYNDKMAPRRRTSSSDRSRKRFSFAEPQGNPLILPEMYAAQSPSPMMCDNRVLADNFDSRMYFHTDPKFQQWAMVNVNPALLSPPSPLDSGLSSQSMASSPSIEIDYPALHQDYVPISRSHRHQACRCPRSSFPEPMHRQSRLSHHDSELSNDTQYTNSYQVSRNGSFNEPNNHIQYSRPIRYGKMGLIGETNGGGDEYVPNPHRKQMSPVYQEESVLPSHERKYNYRYISENGVCTKRPIPRPRRNNKSGHKLIKPFVVISEASEMAAGGEMHRQQMNDNHEKDLHPESPMSMTASTPSSGSSCSNDLDSDDCRRSNRAAEREIRELEDMYQKCNLNDRDLLDRAERRDLPTMHQTPSSQNGTLKRSKSDTIYEMTSPLYRNPYENPQRAPPSRRSGLPDKIADDMAQRKLRKSLRRMSSVPMDNTITYMLCSSHFTPTVPSGHDVMLLGNPDVEHDDLSYRKHYFRKKSEIADPQPPFGIPLKPPPLRKVYSDYLHAIPSGLPKPLCHPRGNPDVIRDDMAFRTLRKDEPERTFYDVAQMYYKKRKD